MVIVQDPDLEYSPEDECSVCLTYTQSTDSMSERRMAIEAKGPQNTHGLFHQPIQDLPWMNKL